MKKILSILALSLLLTVAPTKPAHAAIVALHYCSPDDAKPLPSLLTCPIGFFAGAGAVVGFWADLVGIIGYQADWITPSVMLVLDAQGSLPQDALQEAFSNKYPFIDNTEVTANLGSAVKRKYDETKKADDSAMISLSEPEVRLILAPTDLNPVQIQEIVNDLK